jgi:hypothetical protein
VDICRPGRGNDAGGAGRNFDLEFSPAQRTAAGATAQSGYPDRSRADGRGARGRQCRTCPRKKVLNFVDANRFGSGEGFSRYLLALSRLQVDEVWLSQIRLAEDFMQIEGSSLSAEQVPGYFERFGDEEIFRGNRFDQFELNRDLKNDWKVDFKIATRERGDE